MAEVGLLRDPRVAEPRKESREYCGLNAGGSEMRKARDELKRSSRPPEKKDAIGKGSELSTVVSRVRI